jgi:acetylornithine deacetylase/succinyl-diaminopimelate desuccinylase-like protein
MSFDWPAIFGEAQTHFQNILRIDTTNPPGNEAPLIHYLAKVLRQEGIEPTILESAPERLNLIARYSSGGSDGPIILNSHVDVVPADATQWTHPPFGGVVTDDYIWGRGTIDMKNMTIYTLMTILLAKRYNLKLKRDLIFLAVADEEVGSRYGMQWMVEKHLEKIRAEYALNEVGGFTLHMNGKRLYPIQVEEKGVVWVKLTVKGEPGHGSIPHSKNAVGLLSQIVHRLHTKQLPHHATPITREFVKSLARCQSFSASLILRAIVVPGLGDFLLKKVIPEDKSRALKAQLHNTVSPTVLEGGNKINVIPGEASVSLDCRILPGFTPDSFLKELRHFIGQEVDLEIIKSSAPSFVVKDTPLFQKICEVVERNDPGSQAVPYLMTGFSDSKWLNDVGIKAYGFSPVKIPPDLNFSALFHAHDERIPVEGFHWGIKTFYELVTEFCQ